MKIVNKSLANIRKLQSINRNVMSTMEKTEKP